VPECAEDLRHVVNGQLTGAAEPAERSEYLCVEVCWDLNSTVAQSKADTGCIASSGH
jgi:hypothetical protein